MLIHIHDKKELDGNQALFYKKKIFVNTSIAAQARAANVIGHELLHYAISNRFANDPEALKASVVAFTKYLDEVDKAVNVIGACNTVINNKGKLKGYNTDWVGVLNFIKTNEDPIRVAQQDKINIIGNGGFSKAIQYTCNILDIKYNIITRDKMNLVSSLEGVTLNATPLDIKGVKQLIDCRPFIKQGKIIALLQAKEQYKIYTNVS